MNSSCVQPHEVDQILSEGERGPRATHVADCPRCRALVAQYKQFVSEMSTLPDGANLAEARERMHQTLQSELDRVIGPTPTATAKPDLGWFSRLMATPIGRYGFVTAGVAVAFAVLMLSSDRWNLGQDPGQLRGTGGSEDPFTISNVKLSQIPSGGWNLDWQTVDGVDQYRIEIFSSDLTKLTELPAVDSPPIHIGADLFGDSAAKDAIYFYQIVGLHKGDPSARSDLLPIQIP